MFLGSGKLKRRRPRTRSHVTDGRTRSGLIFSAHRWISASQTAAYTPWLIESLWISRTLRTALQSSSTSQILNSTLTWMPISRTWLKSICRAVYPNFALIFNAFAAVRRTAVSLMKCRLMSKNTLEGRLLLARKRALIRWNGHHLSPPLASLPDCRC